MSKNRLHSIAITGMVAVLTAISIPSASADDGATASWRKGFASWNGSSYDLPEKVPSPWNSFQTSSAGPDSNAYKNGVANADRKPYTVPEGPQSNPYFGAAEGVPATGAAAKQSPFGTDPSDENFADLFTTLAGPAVKSPAVNGAAENSVAKTKPAAPTKLGAPKESFESAVLAAPTNAATSKVPTGSNPAMTPGTATRSPAPNKPERNAEAKIKTSAPAETAKPSDHSVAGKLDETSAEPLPLQTEVVRWYQYPQRWMKGWDSHAEFGLDGSDGNADTLAIQTGMELKRKSDLHSILIDVDYRQASSRNTTTENNGRLNIDYDRMIADSAWSGFGKFGLEWDRFKPFDLRVNLNSGLGYYWIRDDDASLVTRFGAGASREIGAPDDDWIPEAVFGVNAERQVNARNKLKGRLDYFPSWADFGDFRLVADAAWEILLDDSENLSLKLAVTDRYDSTPQGAKPNDVYYSLLLLYKF